MPKRIHHYMIEPNGSAGFSWYLRHGSGWYVNYNVLLTSALVFRYTSTVLIMIFFQ